MIKLSPDAAPHVKNITLYSCLDSDRYIVNFLNKLAEKKIHTIGDILNIDERVLFKEIPTSPSNRKRFREGLKYLGVEFN